MKKLIILLMFVGPVHAQELEIGGAFRDTNGGFLAIKKSINEGTAIKDTAVNLMAGGWSGSRDNGFIGAELMHTHRHTLQLGIGIVYVANKDEHIGTHLNFTTFAGLRFKQFALGWRHISNGDQMLGDNDNWGRDGENKGEDWVTIQYFWGRYLEK